MEPNTLYTNKLAMKRNRGHKQTNENKRVEFLVCTIKNGVKVVIVVVSKNGNSLGFYVNITPLPNNNQTND